MFPYSLLTPSKSNWLLHAQLPSNPFWELPPGLRLLYNISTTINIRNTDNTDNSNVI